MTFVEVLFKHPRRDYYKNSGRIDVIPGAYCIVQAERGEDLGMILSVTNEAPPRGKGKMKEVLRLATEEEIEQLKENRQKEKDAMEVCKKKVEDHDLPMKIIDVEMQFDGNKITFYFTADDRIDFRRLVKDLASTFRTRIELRQIGARDEARRFPGYGICGRVLCCTSWLREFEPVSLKMAKEQNLPLTPPKISGLCGRLMCCLSYELPTYKKLAGRIPSVGQKVCCRGITARVEKVDIFKEEVVLQRKDKQIATMTFNEIIREMSDFGAFRIDEDSGEELFEEEDLQQ